MYPDNIGNINIELLITVDFNGLLTPCYVTRVIILTINVDH